jgi:hypothetical protein
MCGSSGLQIRQEQQHEEVQLAAHTICSLDIGERETSLQGADGKDGCAMSHLEAMTVAEPSAAPTQCFGSDGSDGSVENGGEGDNRQCTMSSVCAESSSEAEVCSDAEPEVHASDAPEAHGRESNVSLVTSDFAMQARIPPFSRVLM